MVDIKLTDEQKEFLKECEEEFKDRYTEHDPSFMQLKTKEEKKPPIMEPWFEKRRQNRDWPRQNQGQNRHSHYGERHYNNRRPGPDRYRRGHFRHGHASL